MVQKRAGDFAFLARRSPAQGTRLTIVLGFPRPFYRVYLVCCSFGFLKQDLRELRLASNSLAREIAATNLEILILLPSPY